MLSRVPDARFYIHHNEGTAMKRSAMVLLIGITLAVITGCGFDPPPKSVYLEPENRGNPIAMRHWPAEQEIEGHTYLIYESRVHHGVNLAVVHAAHCPCQNPVIRDTTVTGVNNEVLQRLQALRQKGNIQYRRMSP